MEALGFCFLFAFFPALLIAIFHIQGQWRRRIGERLRTLAGRLDGGSLTGFDASPFGSLNGAAVTGRLEGRQVSLRLDVRGSGKNQVTYMLFGLEVVNAAGAFRISRAGLLSRFGRWLGVVHHVPTGDVRVDDKFILQGEQGALRRAFQGGELERALDALFRAEFSEVRLERGRLWAERPFREDLLSPAAFERVLSRLRGVADQLERRRLDVKVQSRDDVKVAVRFGWTGGGQEVLCPYCRDAVEPSSGDVGACEACHTLHHRECLEEARGCTVFGCGGRAPGQRVR